MTGEREVVSLNCPRCGAPLTSSVTEMVCAYCGARLILRRSPSPEARQEAPETVEHGLRLRYHVCEDPQSGMPAFRLLVPEGWTVEGGVTWVPNHPAAPTRTHLRLTAPDGVDAIEFPPNQYFTWMNTGMGMAPPPGAFQYGEEVRQPVEARQAVIACLLSRCRNLPGVQMESIDLAPDWAARADLADPIPIGLDARRDGVRALLRYSIAGQPAQEEVCAVVDVVRTIQRMGWNSMELYTWSIRQVAARRHAPGRLEEMAPLFAAILDSIEPNPRWQAGVKQASQELAQDAIRRTNRAGAAAREQGRQLSQIGDMAWEGYKDRQRADDRIWDGWKERQNAMDRTADNYSQAIRGVDAYQDPTSGRTVELPGGYKQAWTNGLGEYILSDEAGFDPNVGSTTSWTELPRR